LTQTFFWHDYETFGADPQRDKAVQFAGVRTDMDFNIVEEPETLYCQPAEDCLPHPEACIITGITPQLAEKKGVIEAQFAEAIHGHLSQPNTCTVGYNNIRFDDEVTRYLFYRNFYDPYGREWQNGNSRWDLIDLVRATYALRPDGIVWPEKEAGIPSFRLEDLTAANHIQHDAAHDALSDVYATIAIAKLIREKQPKLYQYFWQHRSKAEVTKLLRLGEQVPLVHISGMYPAKNKCLAIVIPLALHPTNSNGVIVYDLSVAPEDLLNLSVDDIRDRLFTRNEDLPEGVKRIPLKTVHINKCPIVAPLSVIRSEDAKRLQLDNQQIDRHLQQLTQASGLSEKIAAVFDSIFDETETDPDLMLYHGGFFSPHDKREMQRLHLMKPEQLANAHFDFQDPRLDEMLLRYKARNFPDILNSTELEYWHHYCFKVFTDKTVGPALTLNEFKQRLSQFDGAHQQIVDVLFDYANKVENRLKEWGYTN
jgi:exodeoxyribonuclease-1